MVRNLLGSALVLAFAGCAGDSPTNTNVSVDAAQSLQTAAFDAGHLDAASGDAASGDATLGTQSCTISPSSYDESCQVASDCLNAASGNLCDGLCHAADFAINRRDQARYTADVARATAGQPSRICAGPCEGLPSCESGACKYRSCGASN